jgi:hypothetical protein
MVLQRKIPNARRRRGAPRRDQQKGCSVIGAQEAALFMSSRSTSHSLAPNIVI